MTPRHRVGWIVFILGILLLLTVFGLYVWGYLHGPAYRPGLGPVGVAALVTFIGWFWLRKQDALDGGKFIVDSAIGLLGVIRTGRRSTDKAVAVAPSPLPMDVEQDGDIDIPPHVGGDVGPVPDIAHVPSPEKGP